MCKHAWLFEHYMHIPCIYHTFLTDGLLDLIGVETDFGHYKVKCNITSNVSSILDPGLIIILRNSV